MMPATIHYDLSIPDPRNHTLRVEMRFVTPVDRALLRIPVWTPGSYLVREFARYIEQVEAFDEHGMPLPIVKETKDGWRLGAAAGKAVTVRYGAYCNELTVRTPHIDTSHGFFTGSNVFLLVDGRLDLPSTVTVHPPDGWTTYCSLDSRPDGRFEASDYDTLADTPFELGQHRVHSFDVLGVRHRLIFWGDEHVRIDVESLERDITKIVETNASVFDGALPYRRYDFIFHITHDLRGGLEHLSSTVLATPWRYFERPDERAELLGLIAHEHFHAWNVKRIKPRGLVPFDYSRENLTRGLWVSEGATSYFDDLNCVRAKVVPPAKYLERLADAISRYRQTPGRHAQAVDEASLDAWIRLYRPDENTPNRTISYYLKGSLIHLALDLTIRLRSSGTRCLDDVFALLWQRWLADGAAFDDTAFAAIVRDATGVDVASDLAAWVCTPVDPPLESLLEAFGLRLREEPPKAPDHGMVLDSATDVVVRNVHRAGSAERAGLVAGDVIAAIDGRRVTNATLKGELERLRPETSVSIHFFRRNVLMEAKMTPAVAHATSFKVEPLEGATAEAVARRDAWIGPLA